MGVSGDPGFARATSFIARLASVIVLVMFA